MTRPTNRGLDLVINPDYSSPCESIRLTREIDRRIIFDNDDIFWGYFERLGFSQLLTEEQEYYEHYDIKPLV
jgi:hypothetical protein